MHLYLINKYVWSFEKMERTPFMRKKINKHQLMHLVYLIIKYFFNHLTKIERTPYMRKKNLLASSDAATVYILFKSICVETFILKYECREDMNSFNVVHFL